MIRTIPFRIWHGRRGEDSTNLFIMLLKANIISEILRSSNKTFDDVIIMTYMRHNFGMLVLIDVFLSVWLKFGIGGKF